MGKCIQRRVRRRRKDRFKHGILTGLLLVTAAGLLALILARQEKRRRSQYGPAGCSEFRTPLALDECFDRLADRRDSDVFAYECTRERDGSFTLRLTLHQPTQQPLDTLYTLRLDPGRETIVTLFFIREAFGSPEPVFPPEMLDEFLPQKLDARRTR